MFLHQGIEGVVAEELAMLPGTEEITTLLAIEREIESGDYDFVVVDCAPTDSALRLATLPEVAHRALRLLLPTMQAFTKVATPLAQHFVSAPLPGSQVFQDAETLIFDKLKALNKRITGDETSVRMVVTSERMVIDEARRAYCELALFEVRCDAVVMNRMLPREAAEEEFFRSWSRLQAERRREVEESFAPLPILEAPLFQDEVTGYDRLAHLGRLLFAEVEPDGLLYAAERIRFARDEEGYFAEIPLPGASTDELDVVVIEDELSIRVGPLRRLLKLPRPMARRSVRRATLDRDRLTVRFGDVQPTSDGM
jgi:arsenite-transporting ATPase